MSVQRGRLGIVGATGRMGQQILGLLDHGDTKLFTDIVVLARSGQADDTCRRLKRDSVAVLDDMTAFVQSCDIVLDFAAPAIAHNLAPICAAMVKPYLIASTGLTTNDVQALNQAATRTPILVAANLSRGVNALLLLAEQAGVVLHGWDVEIVETHHRHKRDAPSGTALSLGEAIQLGTGRLQQALPGTARSVPRRGHELGYSVVRGGDVVGEHTAFFFGDGERVELSHRATDRRIFAQGALAACRWLVQQKPGSYSMRDVLHATSAKL